eukprot:15467795-Alexandrium_andersonii.AAC.1
MSPAIRQPLLGGTAPRAGSVSERYSVRSARSSSWSVPSIGPVRSISRCVAKARSPPRSASGAPGGALRRQILHLSEQRRRLHPSSSSGANFKAVSRPAQLQVRTLGAIVACSIIVGVARFDRFDSLLGSIGTRCTCRRIPP